VKDQAEVNKYLTLEIIKVREDLDIVIKKMMDLQDKYTGLQCQFRVLGNHILKTSNHESSSN